jgi:plasmid stabilization system protein ParE
MKVRFLTPANKELDDGYAYYESELQGLDARFVEQIQNTLKRIILFPEANQKVGKYSRRCLIPKFPFGIVYEYRDREPEILVVAVAHLHREPEYWLSRENVDRNTDQGK